MKNLSQNKAIRNIAIVAHVDHGKTTLVDQMFRQSGLFRDNQEVAERIMDNMDLERERGITIAAKNCSILWKDIKINIIDTPGHADFGGEVERALMMVDGAILLVDASEGPLPQTRFVLKKALERNLSILVVINKIDRKDARPKVVLDEVYSLFIDLDANDEQINFPVLFANGREGLASKSLEEPGRDLTPLFDAIVQELPPPSYNLEEPFMMLVADLGYSDYVGRLAIGRIAHGSIHKNDSLVCIDVNNKQHPLRVNKLQVYKGIDIEEADSVSPGDILILAGIEDVHIGDTICNAGNPKAITRVAIDEPTVSMEFSANTGPLSGTEGTIVQSTRIRDRLYKETLRNVSLSVEGLDKTDKFIVKGRGELQMAILIETMRREGFELSVGRPKVIFKNIDGVKMEPVEHVYIDCDEAYLGIVTEKLSMRKGKMLNLVNHNTGRVRIEFNIPSRGLIGYRSEFLTDTRGTGIMNAYLAGYEPFRGDFVSRITGSIVSDRRGNAVPYALYNLEPRGVLFVRPGDPVYEGMIVGEHSKDLDIDVNPTKEKKLTNMRASGNDDAIRLTPVVPLTLEKAIELIKEDEMVEVTPKSIRPRKAILSALERQRLRPKTRS
jgi:GTP-binding protein